MSRVNSFGPFFPTFCTILEDLGKLAREEAPPRLSAPLLDTEAGSEAAGSAGASDARSRPSSQSSVSVPGAADWDVHSSRGASGTTRSSPHSSVTSTTFWTGAATFGDDAATSVSDEEISSSVSSGSPTRPLLRNCSSTQMDTLRSASLCAGLVQMSECDAQPARHSSWTRSQCRMRSLSCCVSWNSGGIDVGAVSASIEMSLKMSSSSSLPIQHLLTGSNVIFGSAMGSGLTSVRWSSLPSSETASEWTSFDALTACVSLDAWRKMFAVCKLEFPIGAIKIGLAVLKISRSCSFPFHTLFSGSQTIP